jgi:hypothetical protein
MSQMKRVQELVNLGLRPAEALRYLADEREALDAGLPVPPLPAIVAEKLGQQQLFAGCEVYVEPDDERSAA